ncbi:flagellar filament outer layer protein FlaA [Treponema socranskii]|uniref:Flagellar filament outer layer protein Flaa n=1 Tax=Treponema socranskii subsp. socranskii VPI DR56BR1116 = ATCC 35536 TaxID=1125725 RepID=U1F6P8_TRESO|nr:flagellar filament outer layer protein FlaA [Treponema socranskii]ERF59652.1 flagellar filament outer layer protein Flaa [Treponema socranskii subsp. socranskii VPI DR56BR1116 = ATCC 35536]ERK04911.1 flagellar filament outer layer protein Flaa [Treponema socranskii subsp. socranskii VPI DR56BR1116 = ATCC 35536]MDR9859228.1 flagellar filament outer layer protein FlaA [Treponema socranskii]
MKKGLVVCMCFGLLLLFSSPAFSQEAMQTQKSTESFMIDNFNNESGNAWTWDVSASRYVADGYPKTGYFDGIPNSLKYLLKDGKDNQKVLGVQIAFKRKGDNWFEVYPVKDGKAYEIPFVGTVTQIDFWVWGAHYMYFLDVIVRDADGRVHVLPAGNLAFDGWKNVVVSVPGWIRQHSRSSSGRDAMSFIGFRIRTSPEEFVDSYTIFFDQMKYVTRALANIFDGYELKEADFGNSEGK